MNLFLFDGSALVKRYVPEPGASLVNHLFTRITHDRLMCLMLGAAETAAATAEPAPEAEPAAAETATAEPEPESTAPAAAAAEPEPESAGPGNDRQPAEQQEGDQPRKRRRRRGGRRHRRRRERAEAAAAGTAGPGNSDEHEDSSERENSADQCRIVEEPGAVPKRQEFSPGLNEEKSVGFFE